jgi:hypothetical protein
MGDYLKPKPSYTLFIEKYNMNGKLCFSKKADVTGIFNKEQVDFVKELILNLKGGYLVNVREEQYIGIYDPSRVRDLKLEIHGFSDKEILQAEIQQLNYELNTLKQRKWWKIF